MASIADDVIGRWFTPSFAQLRPDTVAAIRGVFESTPAEGYAATCEALAEMDQRPDLPRMVAPTLVIAAEHDQSTPPEQSREMVTRMRDARLLLVAAAAHLANVEQPEAVTEAILDHLTARR